MAYLRKSPCKTLGCGVELSPSAGKTSDYKEEMVRRYAAQQQQRQDELSALKAQAEEAREKIFHKLKEDVVNRRAEEEFKENLRNELYLEETEAAARAREQAEAEKRVRVRGEL